MCRFLWVLFTPRVRNLRDGVTPAGSRLLVPRSERRFSLFLFLFWADSSRGSPFGSGLFLICFPIGTRTFLHLSWGGSGPSRWPPLFERRVGGGLPLPLVLVTSFSILLLMSFGLRSPYGSCALVGSPFSTTVGCRWCLALAPSGWDSCLCLRLLFVPCGCQCVSWWSSLRPRVLGVLGSLQCASLSGVRHLSRVCSSVWGPFGVAHPFHPSLLLGEVIVRFCRGPY